MTVVGARDDGKVGLMREVVGWSGGERRGLEVGWVRLGRKGMSWEERDVLGGKGCLGFEMVT
jgi:hypothetical protein